MGPFVDCHSHVVPSGDDGAASISEGLDLCHSAREHGTGILFATPHIWPYFTLDRERELDVVDAYERMRVRARLDLRLGYELTPSRALLREDPNRYVLDGRDCVLMEVPFSGSADIGPARLELTVDPARVGPNEMHVYLFDRRAGAQWD